MNLTYMEDALWTATAASSDHHRDIPIHQEQGDGSSWYLNQVISQIYAATVPGNTDLEKFNNFGIRLSLLIIW